MATTYIISNDTADEQDIHWGFLSGISIKNTIKLSKSDSKDLKKKCIINNESYTITPKSKLKSS
jgi:hypothetical protein